MGRFWSILFLLVPILGVGFFVWAMAGLVADARALAAGEYQRRTARVIDNLFMFILGLTGVDLRRHRRGAVLVPVEVRRQPRTPSR